MLFSTVNYMSDNWLPTITLFSEIGTINSIVDDGNMVLVFMNNSSGNSFY